MFGKNKIEKQLHNDGSVLQVVNGSPFLTIQGEGPYAGHSAVFIRLHGCHLRCTFCDTEFDSPDDQSWTINDLVEAATGQIRRQARLMVITGGEPMRQNILPLCQKLDAAGFKVQIETAGTFWIEGIQHVAEIICSPKTPTIHKMIEIHARAFKYVISGSQQFDVNDFIPITTTQPGARLARLATPRLGAPVYLSPCDEYDESLNTLNRKLVGNMAMRFGVIAGVQLHKFLDLP